MINVILKSLEATTHTDHNTVRLNHQHACLSANHILALVVVIFIVKFDERKLTVQEKLQLLLVHDL